MWFRLMGPDVSGYAKAHWRMLMGTLMLLPLAVHDYRSADAALRAKILRDCWVAAPIGVIFGSHFVAVALSTNTTSYTHMLLTVNTASQFFSLGIFLRFLAYLGANAAGLTSLVNTPALMVEDESTGSADAAPSPSSLPPETSLPFLHPTLSRPLSALEFIGAAIAFSGLVLLVAGESGKVAVASVAADNVPTVEGDLVGLLSSMFFAVYLFASKNSGSTPLYLYMFLLHASAAVATAVGAIALGTPAHMLVGWTAGGMRLCAAIGSGLIPSIVGHTICNYLLMSGRLPPSTVLVVQQNQPITGIILGYIFGLAGAPSLISLLSFPVVMAGCFCTLLGSFRKTP